MNQGTTDNPSATSTHAGRHGCLTAYLVFIIIVNSAAALVYLFGREWLQRNRPQMPEWAFWLLAICEVISVISAIALLRWKRWGFWLLVVSVIAGVGINFSIGLGSQGILGAVLGIAILYALLHIGGERKAWPRLQ